MLKLTQSIGSRGLLAIDLVSAHSHQTRWIRIRKPPWVPRAKNKQFRIPPLHVQDPTIKSYMTPIWSEYKTNMRSIYQLFKTEAKFSDKASFKAQEEKRQLEAEEKRLYEENDRVNREILDQQLRDEELLLGEKKKHAENELKKKVETEKRLVELADQKVRRLKEQARTFIDPKNLEMEIEKALNETKSYNFAIDEKGKVYKTETN